jgi:hypothetical protein
MLADSCHVLATHVIQPLTRSCRLETVPHKDEESTTCLVSHELIHSMRVAKHVEKYPVMRPICYGDAIDGHVAFLSNISLQQQAFYFDE